VKSALTKGLVAALLVLTSTSCRRARSNQATGAIDGGQPLGAPTRAPDAGSAATSVDAGGATGRTGRAVASDLVAFAVGNGTRYALSKSDSNRDWRVEVLGEGQQARHLATQAETFADHAAITTSKNGALLALTLLDDRSGGIYELRREGSVKLLDGDLLKAMFTSVAADGDYVFGASPLVRLHRPSKQITKIPSDANIALLAASAGSLFVADHRSLGDDPPRYRILSMPCAAAKLSELAKGEGIVYGLAASPDATVWTVLDATSNEPGDDTTGTLWLAPRRGGKPVRLATGLAYPVGVALDRTHAYVALRSAGGVVRVPLAGGAPEAIAVGIGEPTFVAVDDRFVYAFASSSRTHVHAPYFMTASFDTDGDLLAFEK
jgi:hypothetical protein